MNMRTVLLALPLLAVATRGAAEEAASRAPDARPVCDSCNPLFLKGLAGRPWWNAAWEKRLQVVVSETGTNKVASFLVDAVVDFGEEIDPKEVRVVSGCGDEVACWAGPEKPGADGAAKAGLVRVQFRTDLRKLENKPFFLYFGNPKAERAEVPQKVWLAETDRRVTLDNGRLHLEFAKDSRVPGPLHVFKIVGSESENELVADPGGTAHFGLAPVLAGGRNGASPRSPPTKVVAELVSPWKAVVTAESERVRMTYVLYADSDRVDYVYEPLSGHRLVGVSASWASGGGIAWDDIVYPSLTGSLRTMRAALDIRSDSGGEISYPDLGDWCGEGWFLIRDRVSHTAIGQFYNPGDFGSLSHAHYDDGKPAAFMRLAARPGKGKPVARHRGAAFGTFKGNGAVRRDYRVWASPPKVLVGAVERVHGAAERKPDMRHDFCAFLHTGVDSALNGVKADARFIDDEAERLARAVRRLGLNGVMLGGTWGKWESLGLRRESFDYLAGLTNHPNFRAYKADCGWEEGQERYRRFRHVVKALRDRGLGVFHWGHFMGHSRLWPRKSEGNFERIKGYGRFREIDLEVAGQTAKAGLDSVWCGIIGNEGPDFSSAEVSKMTGSYTLWPAKEREAYLDYLDSYVDHVRAFRKAVKEANPDANVLAWGCDNGNLGAVERHLECSGLVDVVIEEIMVGDTKRASKNKANSAQMRAMFDNEPHTVWNHFWARAASDDFRIGNADQAFAFGVNGFNHESDDYAYVDRDNVGNMGDFYLFARYTGLADISPKLVPVKYAAVYRDSDEVRQDILLGDRAGHTWSDPWPKMAFTDVAAHNWAAAPGLQCDYVLNQFFTLEGLRRYRILALAHNAHLPRDRFETVREFVRGGGVCYVEGEDFPFAEEILALPADASLAGGKYQVRTLGKGRFVFAAGHDSRDRNASHLAAGGELRALLAKAAGAVEPVVFEHGDFRRLDGQLRGDGERFLFCAYAENAFNGGRPGLVKVRLDIPPRAASSGPLFALDVKRARRVPFDGAVEYLQVPGECAFVLIGDGRLTEVPGATVIEAGDAGNRAPLGLLPGAARGLAERAALGDFREPARVVMFDRAGEGGHAQPNFRFTACAVEQDVVTAKTFAKARFLDSLAKAKALVFCSDVDPEESEVVFASCGEEVKDFLRRGGTILFHCCPTPDSARKLFAEIGVFDPGAHGGRVKVRDGWCSQDEGHGKDHLIYKSVRSIDTPWGRGGMLQFDHAFVKWDRERQQAFYMAKPEWRVDGKDTAMLVAQEGVLGAGKVVFEENDRAFTTWYENQIYGENLISYVIGMNVGEHVRKVRLLNGGPGEAAGD